MAHLAQYSHAVNEPHVIKGIQNIIDKYAAESNSIDILEAGCGSYSRFKLSDKAIMSGIDISEEQLSRNPKLDVRIRGDIQTYTTNKKYDIVICWNVLEHLEDPRKALSNLLTWTKNGGIVIISVPNVFSVKGIITKITPHWFHKWFYKHIHGVAKEPFPTYMRFAMSPKSLLLSLKEQNIEYKEYLNYSLRYPYGYLYKVLVAGIKIITLGKVDGDLSEFYLVIRKKGD